jgi:hypothetical protein
MKSKIESLLERSYSDLDEELQSHLLNYICILESGYLEQKIETILDNYKKSHHCTTHECKDSIKSMRKIQNAKWCSIRPMLVNIDDSILVQLKEKLDFDSTVGSIDNIVKTRHKIAHGESVSNLTILILRRDFTNIVKFIDELNSIFSTL